MATQNPNYPLVTYIADFTQGPPSLPGASAMSLNAPARRNAVRKCDITRGRQYELDQVQSGTATLTITDPLEYLHPSNGSSPFNTGGNTITSYRCMQIGAWWNPTPPLNSNATFETGLSPWTASGGTAAQSLVRSHSGVYSAQFTPDGVSSQGQINSDTFAVTAGTSYQFAAWMWLTTAVTGAASVSVNWYNSSLGYLSSGTNYVSVGAGAWTKLSASYTAPTGAAYGQIVVAVAGTQPSSNVWYVDDALAAPPVGNLAGNFLNSANPIPGEPWLGANYLYGYDPAFQSWATGNPALSGAMTFAVSTDHPDGSNTVWKATASSTTDAVSYAPKVIPGQTYQLFVDVWANTGVTVALGWTGNTPVSTTTTTTGSFQRISLTFVGDAIGLINFNVSASTGGFPASFYVSNVALLGQPAGWLVSGAPTIAYSVGSLQGNMSASTDTLTLPLPTVPGRAYTFSANVYASGTGTVATQTIGVSSASTTTVNVYQRLVLTFTAADAVTNVVFSATGSAYPASFYLNQVQLELGSSASAFTTSGPTYYPLYTGYIERFPLQWDMQGTRGIRPLTCVDALSILSRTEISQSYKAAIFADGPNLFMPYNDQSIPQVVQLPQGGQPFLGYQNLGTQGAVNFQGDTFLDGTSTVSISQQNSNPPTFGDTSYITYLGTSAGSIYMNPQAFTIEVWAKIEAGEPYFGAGAVPATESLNVEPFGPAHGVGWYTFLGGRLGWSYNDPNGTGTNGFLPGFSGYPDGKWHYFAIKLIGGNGLTVALDNFIGGVATLTPSGAVQLNNFYVDAQAYYGDPVTTISVANMACYPYALSNAQLANHYNMGTGYLGELPGARVARFLSQYWGGPTNVAAGKRQLAPDNASGSDYNTRFVLDVLQEIQETERGLVYASAAGVVTFEDSTTRYTSNLTSKWVFGENPPGASPVEYPYIGLEEGFDPTYTFSQTNLTRPGNSSFQPLPNPLPTNPPYGQRVLSQQVQVNTDFDLYQASTFYLKRYGSPTLRVEKLTLNPAANPALWPVILSLEISQRITVKRRTSAGLTTTADYYIEQISHNIDGDAGTWTVDLQCSPVFNSTAWILGDPTYGVLGSTTIPVY